MIFNCGPSFAARLAAKKELCKAKADQLHWWHEVFAWLPVRVAEDKCIWLGYVERRCQYVRVEYRVRPFLPDTYKVSFHDEEYREIQTDE